MNYWVIAKNWIGGHVACKERKGIAYTVLVRQPKGKTVTLEDLCIDGRVILEWILKKSFGRVLAGLVWLRIRKMGRFYENGNEPFVAQNRGIY